MRAVVRALRTAGSVPGWVSWLGTAANLLLIVSAVEVFGIDAGFLLTISVTVLQAWFLAVAATLRPAVVQVR